MIKKEDIGFIKNKLLPWSGVKRIRLAWSNSTAKFPDIWLSFEDGLPTITVTKEWRRQNMQERRKRLVHEMLHLQGLEHPEGGSVRIGKYVYSTFPAEDSYSRAIYRRLQ